jgi:SAM-dependent methyltransferase
MKSAPGPRPHHVNSDPAVVDGFGDEWTRFDQTALPADDERALFDSYFSLFPWGSLPDDAAGVDVGCGSGRWARLVAPRVGMLHCVDASSAALEVARRALLHSPNAAFHHASAGALPFEDASMDFVYSLGVLHHVPDTQAALNECVRILKPGAPLLVYLYYAFDNRSRWFRMIWRASDLLRKAISRLPYGPRYVASQALAAGVYWPLARCARLLDVAGVPVGAFPLSAYRNRSFYTMRTDALDRFGTRLEQRFSRGEIMQMMELAGLVEVKLNDEVPFWCAVGRRNG